MSTEIEITEIKTRLGEFIVGTINNTCCIFDFKYRKSIKSMLEKKKKQYNAVFKENKNALHGQIEEEINLYLDGDLTKFTIPLDIKGTDFQKKVWNKLLEIPYGETISYKELAKRVGNESAMRAVGGANGANNIAIIIPCHRVIRADGELQGYGGGLSNKKKLLQLEKLTKNKTNSISLDNFFD